jgi:hypothetical protein
MREERRKYQRTPAAFDIVWKDKIGKHQMRTADLSASGCFIDNIATELKVGEEIKIKLRLPAGEFLHLKAEVVYNHDVSGFGLHFIEVTDFDKKRLEWLIKAEIHRAKKQNKLLDTACAA